MNSKELLNNWSKIGFLTSLTYPLGNPDIKSGYQSSIGSVRAPLLYFTLGDLYKKREAFIESLQYTVPDNSNWQLDGAQTDYESSKEFFESAGVRNVPTVENGYKLPHMVEVAVTMKFLEQRRNTERRENLYGFTPLNNDDIYVATQTGDRLDLLSKQYYGTPAYWWIIANANNIHDAKLGLTDGTILRIPKDFTEIVRKETSNA